MLCLLDGGMQLAELLLVWCIVTDRLLCQEAIHPCQEAMDPLNVVGTPHLQPRAPDALQLMQSTSAVHSGEAELWYAGLHCSGRAAVDGHHASMCPATQDCSTCLNIADVVVTLLCVFGANAVGQS